MFQNFSVIFEIFAASPLRLLLKFLGVNIKVKKPLWPLAKGRLALWPLMCFQWARLSALHWMRGVLGFEARGLPVFWPSFATRCFQASSGRRLTLRKPVVRMRSWVEKASPKGLLPDIGREHRVYPGSYACRKWSFSDPMPKMSLLGWTWFICVCMLTASRLSITGCLVLVGQNL